MSKHCAAKALSLLSIFERGTQFVIFYLQHSHAKQFLKFVESHHWAFLKWTVFFDELSHSPFQPNHRQQLKTPSNPSLVMKVGLSIFVELPNPFSHHTISRYVVTINLCKLILNFSRLNIICIKNRMIERTHSTVNGLRNYLKHFKQSLTHVNTSQ